ncbi:asparagine synthetase domain-containing protein [Aspergillus vadensis CBS 113365]|uniref:Asparagine synthase related protein n=1 Tax=Aspergillus vadensis (strain CBS 113365 / IMI 142717 / IBT 24658) TaxID=1448311 RepID=A0A319C6Y5_ASPVC|nr:asparagine synthase related protein [Aspergillus vadensis CBS 113365]PYH74193.1 asparagine synthase related protein [Aspergillus vadensis CBS 113365]
MCGIFFSLSASGAVLPNEETCCLLRKRGPDNYHVHSVEQKITNTRSSNEEPIAVQLTFVSTVLSMRGGCLVPQPLVDPTTQSVLCYNGDAWKISGEPIQGNDAELIFRLLLQAVNHQSKATSSADLSTSAVQGVLDVISSISGPFAFVFYDAINSKLFFTRDSLGRRSLLQGVDESGVFKLCSLCDGTSSTHFSEVETDGVYVVDLEHAIFQDNSIATKSAGTPSFDASCIQTLYWEHNASDLPLRPRNPVPPMNNSIPEGEAPSLTVETTAVKELEQKLRQSLALRIQNVREPPTASSGSNVKVAVLFSGGLDCTLLARLSHEILPKEEVIDLLNVAFENPRVAAAAKGKGEATGSVYENCPDRITGRAAFAELQRVCPDRNWRFVAVDVPYQETLAHRETVKRLMRPHNTEMDLSIACALYFASRGQGLAFDSRQIDAQPMQYATSARVLLSGLGADELFAGYSRHGAAFSRDGFAGLIDEINLDVSRLGKRNLGRDNRVIAHWGREARFPFLDEEFVSWVVQLPVWEKCGFGTPSPPADSPEAGLDSEKKALRLVALRLGMTNVAREKKRAIQFGSRTAKMEKSKVKGTDALT